MRILIDTNILIYREDSGLVTRDLQELLRIILENKHTILVHPRSVQDIENDLDSKRRGIILSKLKSYPLLGSPPTPDTDFLEAVNHDTVRAKEDPDNHILYAVYRNAADILITQDNGILHKSQKTQIGDRVMDITSALAYFRRLHKRQFSHVLLKEEYLYNITVDDPIFDSLKRDYAEFITWFEKVSRAGRKCWIYEEQGSIRAILIYKEEAEVVDAAPSLPKKRRFKIATLTVDLTGYKIGELLLKLAFQYCIDRNIDEIYLTHFGKEEDYLVDLISEFGFESCGKNRRGEAVYLKNLRPANGDNIDPVEMSRRFYPSLKDGSSIRKFVVPIIPEFHDRLFQDYGSRQMRIIEYLELNIQGNTIKKAYLSHSKITKIRPGDILLFYRSKDQQKISSLGVVEAVYPRLTDENEIVRLVGKRSVYTYGEIRELTKKPVTVIIFRHHFHLKNPLDIKELVKERILRSAPQTIIQIEEGGYRLLKKKGGIDERFAFN